MKKDFFSEEIRRNREKDPCKQGKRRHVTGREAVSSQIRAADRIYKGGRPYILERPPLYAGAVGRNRVLSCSDILYRKVEPASAFSRHFFLFLEKERNSRTGIALKHYFSVSWITPQQRPVRQRGVRWAHGMENS